MKKASKSAITIILVMLILQTCFSGAMAATLPLAGDKIYISDDLTTSQQITVNNLAGTTSSIADYSVSSYNSLIETITRQYIARDTYFTIKYSASLSVVQNNISDNNQLWNDIYSLDIPGTTSDLDYLHNNISEMSISWRYSGTYAICEFSQTYLTSSSQEQYVNTSVSTILSNLDIGDASTFGKIKAIHDYIINNVDYDMTYGRYSAYDALYLRSTVCQGYTLLFYKMLMEAGIPVRFISGEATTGSARGAHAWNIVKIGQYWYNVDVTWDDSYETTKYMLKNNTAFSDHYRDSAFSTSAFKTAYPMSPVNFDLTQDVKLVSSISITGATVSADIPLTPSAWAQDGIDALNARGVIPSELKSAYRDSITRAEFMALIANVYEYAKGPYALLGSLPFTDISGSPYKNDITLGYELGIVGGIGSNLFGPDNTLTREQCAVIVSNTVKGINGTTISSNVALSYADIQLISSWALPYVRYAFESGLMLGAVGNFNPKVVLTREQAMLIAERMIEKYKW